MNLANTLCVKIGLGPHQRPDLDLTALSGTELLGFTTDQLERLLVRAASCAAGELEPYASVWLSRGDGHVA